MCIIKGSGKVQSVHIQRTAKEKVAKRVMGWKEKHRSNVGREVLIKTIAQAIPTYSMSLFKISKQSVMV